MNCTALTLLALSTMAGAAQCCSAAPIHATNGLTIAGLAEGRGAPILGSAANFSVLAGSGVTNTGPSVINGNLGVWPNNAVTGFPPGIVVGGVIHAGDAVAMTAQNDLTTAYNTLAGMAPTTNLTGMDLGGMTLTAGVYFFSSSAQLTGTLTLDAQGISDAQFVFQIGSTLTSASSAMVKTINAADGCNVFWQIGSSATLGTETDFVGSLVALTSITLTTGVDIVDGRALARNGAVTMDTNTITSDCDLSVPLPSAAGLAFAGLAGLMGSRPRRPARARVGACHHQPRPL